MPWDSLKIPIVRPAQMSAAAMISAALCNPGTASAAVLAEAAGPLTATCGSIGGGSLQVAASPVSIIAPSTKSSAILGGQPSALELIRLSQENEGAAQPTGPAALAEAAELAPQPALSPAAGGMRTQPEGCSSAGLAPHTTTLGGNDFLASRRLEIGRTAYDRDWRRVSGERISKNRYRRILGTVAGDRMATLASVNRWVNRSIAFTDDRELFSRADYWAGAATTLRLRRGDCEDIAFTKMQLLAAAGIPRENMILTIARDLVRNADHAVLIVHHEGHYYMLDNASDEVFDASLSHDYRPILSFGTGHTWLHGY